jgi:hypothetical protein
MKKLSHSIQSVKSVNCCYGAASAQKSIHFAVFFALSAFLIKLALSFQDKGFEFTATTLRI